MASYGLFRGLNEAYDSYRGRQRGIEDMNRRKMVDEMAQQRSDREQEEYQYGITRRGVREKAEELALGTGEMQLKQAQGTYSEWVANTASRATLNKLNLDKALQDFETSGLVYDQNKMTLDAKKGAEKYNKWTREWLQGGTMEDIVKKFNTDEDDTNNIQSVTGSEEKGWDVTFENGRTQRFEDRDQVAIHLQSMADPNFHQTYLLQVEAGKAALAKAIALQNKKSVDQTSKDKKTWEAVTLKQTDRYFAKTINEGIVDFGSEGSRRIAGDVRAVVDSVGAASAYGMINSDVTRVANSLAESMLVKSPAERKRMAEETLDAQREKGEAIPEEGDDGYDVILNRQMAEDYDRAYDQFKNIVYTKFFTQKEDGTLQMKSYQQVVDFKRAPESEPAGDTITAEGLERPGESTLTSSEPGASTSAPVVGTESELLAPSGESAAGLPTRGEQTSPDEYTRAEIAAVYGTRGRLESEALSKKEKRVRDNATRVWGADRARQIGVQLKGRWKKADKEKIKQDFTKNFESLTLAEQKDWYTAFARGVDAATRKKANAIIKSKEA
jgi:hypothetical protein